jgi:hypothetical protein
MVCLTRKLSHFSVPVIKIIDPQRGRGEIVTKVSASNIPAITILKMAISRGNPAMIVDAATQETN